MTWSWQPWDIVSDTAPEWPVDNQPWIDTSSGEPVLRVWLNDAWVPGRPVDGTLTQSLPALTQSLDGGIFLPEGTITQTLPALTQSMTGSNDLIMTGSAAQTLPALTQSAQGTLQ